MVTLITGGAGFVGLNVAEHLLKTGDDVVLFGPSPPPELAFRALRRNPGNLSFLKGDVSIRADLDTVLEARAINRIVHGAAITADLARERRAARDIFTTNVSGTIEVLEAALRHQVPRVVQLSTGAVFGTAGRATDTLDEETSRALPETLYGISKFAAERIGLRYRHTRNLDVTIVRLGTVFGRWEYDSGDRDTLSIALQLLRLAENGGTAIIHRDTPDDWIYSVDVARGVAAILALIRTPDPLYHLSAGTRWSVEEWCERLGQRFPEFKYRMTDRLEDCTVRRNQAATRSPMNIARIRRDAGYEPAYLQDRAFDDYLAWRDANRGYA